MAASPFRMLRIQAGKTQRNIADAARCSVSRISLIERGEVIPDLAEITRLAAALNCPVKLLSGPIKLVADTRRSRAVA